MWQPVRDLIRITRLEGHGIENVSKGGIVMPATREKSVRTKGDYFRARVESIGPDAKYAGDELREGLEVLVYTYSGTEKSVFTGHKAEGYEFIEPDDILCVVEGT